MCFNWSEDNLNNAHHRGTNTCSMALICTANSVGTAVEGWMVISCGAELLVASETEISNGGDAMENGVLRLGIDHSTVACCGFSPSNLLLAACSDEKKLKIWKTKTWNIVMERVLPKRATAVQFTNDDQYILVSDKAGDLHRYALTSDPTSPGQHLLGHFSMLLDMVLSPSNSHVITCDRDEKIRVSKYPNSYNIETYCLAHTDFVTRICLSKSWPNLLLSTSGDGTLRSWDWERGRLLDTAVVGSIGKAGADDEPKVLTHLCCSRLCDTSGRAKVVVAMEKCCELLSFDLLSKGKLTCCHGDDAILSLATPPWSLAFDWLDRLWVCLPHPAEPLVCYKLDDSAKLLKVADNNNFLNCLGKWSLLEGAIGNEKNWSQLRKQVYDNMSAYLTRKEERLRGKEEQISELQESDTPAEPPDKKIRVEGGR